MRWPNMSMRVSPPYRRANYVNGSGSDKGQGA